MTKEKQQEIIEEYEKTKETHTPYREISKKVGVSIGTISRLIRKHYEREEK